MSSFTFGDVKYKVKDESALSASILNQGNNGQVLIKFGNGVSWENLDNLTKFKKLEQLVSELISSYETDIQEVDDSIAQILNEKLSNIDSSINDLIETIDASINDIIENSSVIEKIDSSINDIEDRLSNIDSSINYIIEHGTGGSSTPSEDDYELEVDEKNNLIKVFVPYNTVWELSISSNDTYLDYAIKTNVENLLDEYYPEGYTLSSYIIEENGNTKDYIDISTNMKLFSIEDSSTQVIIDDFHNMKTILLIKSECAEYDPIVPYTLSTSIGISSNIVTFTIDDSLDDFYYQRKYCLELKEDGVVKTDIII